jgi:ABC-type nickel/cobalt efflux system permease component RcnA
MTAKVGLSNFRAKQSLGGTRVRTLKDAVGIIVALVFISVLLSGCVFMSNRSTNRLGVMAVGVILIAAGWWLARNTNLEKWSMQLIGAGALLLLLA